MRFVDEARILVRSGHGGRGCVSFRREKYVPKGGPDGGDGGAGGDVIVRASSRLLTLYDYRHQSVQEAENGRPGGGSLCFGRAGAPKIVEVPVGTLVFEETEDGEVLLADLVSDGQEVVVARGGRGGKGNAHFKSATMRTPRFAQPGEPGEEKRLRLELKVFADAGLLGLPNAGKSTFLSRISAARPKIAPYPFTTLTPQLGVMEHPAGTRMVVADIPGLVEGAHAGVGLGHTFLRHVERTRFLVHLAAAPDVEGEDPGAVFAMLNEELRLFDAALAQKPQLLVVNKIDLLDAPARARLAEALSAAGISALFMSALDGEGVEAVVAAMWAMLETAELAGAAPNPDSEGKGDGRLA
ncbi:MAG: GTPase ObgE [Desulfomicrobiaceae bacterium]